MLKSMTAFSRKESTGEWGTLTWEMRSVNHRYLDISLRLSEEFRAVEPVVRERLNARLSRGKIEVSLKYKAAQTVSAGLVVNEELARQVVEAARAVQQLAGHSEPVSASDIFRWPGVIGQAETDLGSVHQAALALLDTTIDDYIDTRGREGEKTAAMLEERCAGIVEILKRVRELRPQAAARQRSKLLARLADLEVEHDSGRLEQELVYIAQKMDIDEELDRLGAHVSELRDVLQRDEPVGRRLDFLVQEFNREANTLGSKSSDSEVTAQAVDLKVLIEQMREQVQNIE
jgi:uncharacterized protein (TIGR00255 family)